VNLIQNSRVKADEWGCSSGVGSQGQCRCPRSGSDIECCQSGCSRLSIKSRLKPCDGADGLRSSLVGAIQNIRINYAEACFGDYLFTPFKSVEPSAQRLYFREEQYHQL
jgi:hypothetical protein